MILRPQQASALTRFLSFIDCLCAISLASTYTLQERYQESYDIWTSTVEAHRRRPGWGEDHKVNLTKLLRPAASYYPCPQQETPVPGVVHVF